MIQQQYTEGVAISPYRTGPARKSAAVGVKLDNNARLLAFCMAIARICSKVAQRYMHMRLPFCCSPPRFFVMYQAGVIK
jgi:hypothetical protein